MVKAAPLILSQEFSTLLISSSEPVILDTLLCVPRVDVGDEDRLWAAPRLCMMRTDGVLSPACAHV